MAKSSLSKLPKWASIVRSNPAVYERDVFSGAPILKPDDAARLVLPRLSRLEVEEFLVVPMDSQRRPLAVQAVTHGILNQSLVHPRETFRLAIVMGAAAIIVAHNHPSGEIEPSADDIAATERLVTAGRLLDIPLFDHILVGGSQWVSFAMRGLL